MRPLPDNEVQRLRALRSFHIIDTEREQAFDDLARLAATICETPISLISLVDSDRLWFKARVGLDAPQIPRNEAFCAYAITQPQLLEVEDATEDRRFQNHPLVTSDPKIRFYCGAPLTLDTGMALGTLCVIDRVPRRLTEAQREALSILRDAVVSQMQLRRALDEVRLLEGLLPMCAWCHNVKRDDGHWTSLSEYVTDSGIVTHGICPSCSKDMKRSA